MYDQWFPKAILLNSDKPEMFFMYACQNFIDASVFYMVFRLIMLVVHLLILAKSILDINMPGYYAHPVLWNYVINITDSLIMLLRVTHRYLKERTEGYNRPPIGLPFLCTWPWTYIAINLSVLHAYFFLTIPDSIVESYAEFRYVQMSCAAAAILDLLFRAHSWRLVHVYVIVLYQMLFIGINYMMFTKGALGPANPHGFLPWNGGTTGTLIAYMGHSVATHAFLTVLYIIREVVVECFLPTAPYDESGISLTT